MSALAGVLAAGSVLLLSTGLWRWRAGAMESWLERRRVMRERTRPAASPGRAMQRLRLAITVVLALLGGALLFGVLFVLSRSLAVGLTGALGGFLIPGWWMERQRTREMVRISEQLDHAMGILATALRRGTPLEVAFSQAATTVGAPLGEVLGYVGAAAGLGVTFGQALAGVRQQPAVAGVADFQVFLTQVAISHERGANILHTFETLRQTLAARRQYRAAVAEQMGQHLIQSLTITGVGMLVLIAYASMTPEGLRPLVGTGVGKFLLLTSVVGNLGMLRLTHISLLRQLRRI